MLNMNTDNKLLLLYGGTFDPVHFGHLLPSIKLAEQVHAISLTFIPCYLPPHKSPAKVTCEHRLAMLKLALQQVQRSTDVQLGASDFEIQQEGHSFTRLTVEHFHSKLDAKESLGFVIGMDSLLSFTTWFKWKEVLDYCDIYVMQRPGYPLELSKLDGEIRDLLGTKIHLIETDEVNISSTEIRQSLVRGLDKAINQLPESVYDYIKQHGMYSGS